ncbi:hypothetical protein R1flu_012533 [Riccia fluitans]|uniref:Uncharacterized protein n=1 Tax=Riccia fluitans TaxID=41844 RepID=A0ABD1ZAW3_9MARC
MCCASALAVEYLCCGQLQKAAELFEVCIESKRLSFHGDFIVELLRAFVTELAGTEEKAKEIINSAIQRAGEVLLLDWELKAYLLVKAEEIKSTSDGFKDSVKYRELALTVCVENKFKFTRSHFLGLMVVSFSRLIQFLAHVRGDTVHARKVYGLVAPFINNRQLSEFAISIWETAEEQVWRDVGNVQAIHEKAIHEAEDLLESEFKVSDLEAENLYDAAENDLVVNRSLSRDAKMSTLRMLLLAELQVMHGNINEGFQVLDDLEKMENNKGGSLISVLLHLDRAAYLLHYKHEIDLALQEVEKVENILEQMLLAKSPFEEKIHRLSVYKLRYEAQVDLDNLPGCLLLLDKVQEFVPASGYSSRAWVHHNRAAVLFCMKRLTDAAAEAQIASSLCMTLQSQFGREEKEDLEAVWVSILSGTLFKPCLHMNEALSLGMKDACRGLIWAERKHMRFYMNRIQSSSTMAEITGMFDRSNIVASDTIFQTVAMCCERMAVVKYSYHEERQELFLYVASPCHGLNMWLCDKSPDLRKIFVAGNPKPMGGRKPQLQGTEEEVREVAAILGVEPHVGMDCSKEAIR